MSLKRREAKLSRWLDHTGENIFPTPIRYQVIGGELGKIALLQEGEKMKTKAGGRKL